MFSVFRLQVGYTRGLWFLFFFFLIKWYLACISSSFLPSGRLSHEQVHLRYSSEDAGGVALAGCVERCSRPLLCRVPGGHTEPGPEPPARPVSETPAFACEGF